MLAPAAAGLVAAAGAAMRSALRRPRYPLSELGRTLQLLRHGRDSLFDVILSFDGNPVPDPRELVQMVGDAAAGDVVLLEILRDGERITLTVTLQVLSSCIVDRDRQFDSIAPIRRCDPSRQPPAAAQTHRRRVAAPLP